VHIHVVTMPGALPHTHYLISRLGEIWTKEHGHRVTVGPVRTLEADLGILHVDRTRVPSEVLPENPAGRPLLNGTVLDISKRRFCRNLLGPDSSYTGPVIIKTDANCFGGPEIQEIPVFRKLRRFAARCLPWQLTRELPRKTYPVLEGLSEVPDWVWRREDLIVDRLLSEREGEEYVLRIWIFFGEREYGIKAFGRSPVLKINSITRYEYIDAVPDELRAVRAELNMDFGKFDYAMVNGKAVLYDVNKTATVGISGRPSTNLQRLAGGLDRFMRCRS
jgi:hypothetical protein